MIKKPNCPQPSRLCVSSGEKPKPAHRPPRESVASKLVAEVKEFAPAIVDASKTGADMSKDAPLGGPAFPQAGKGSDVTSDMIPTYAYNWCVSPLTPMAVAGDLDSFRKQPRQYACLPPMAKIRYSLSMPSPQAHWSKVSQHQRSQEPRASPSINGQKA